jgi:hypothetical protein
MNSAGKCIMILRNYLASGPAIADEEKVHGKNEKERNLPSASAATHSTQVYTTPQACHNLITNVSPPAELEPFKVVVAVALDVSRSTHGHLLFEAARYLRCNGQVSRQ